MKRTLLLVDGEKLNRSILKKAFGDEYNFLKAENGSDALKILRTAGGLISAVLLDLATPEPDGYSLLEQILQDHSISNIPIIVMTEKAETESDIKSRAMGMVDCILKPYNADVVLQRVKSAITLHETTSDVSLLRKDSLTGLYNREAFFEEASTMIAANEPGYYVMSCFDIDNFKIINNQCGTEDGDKILIWVGRRVLEDMSHIGGLCGRINADNFAALYPAGISSGKNHTILNSKKIFPDGAGVYTVVTLSIGRYIITDPTLTPNTIYDRAHMAKRSVKGRYDRHIAYFDESMLEYAIMQQRIISKMDSAIAERQFEIWFQPQFNHSSGALIGAEALTRWRHPELGLILPCAFIPVFENNGFIYELDKYIWEYTCIYLRKWLDNDSFPPPVSVNISRYDILCPDLVDILSGLIEKYDIPVSFLHLEITESAFAKSAEQVVSVAKELVELGFIVEIDDFGSGYSSLNALKDVPAQVVKLDMRFLEANGNSQRGENILESVVRMIKRLNMSVIAEGVETLEHANFLKSIGCSFVQGNLYSPPLPCNDYELLMKKQQRQCKSRF